MGEWYRHMAAHNGAEGVPLRLDPWGRCLDCLAIGAWRADA
jgi:hypothetical protein